MDNIVLMVKNGEHEFMNGDFYCLEHECFYNLYDYEYFECEKGKHELPHDPEKEFIIPIVGGLIEFVQQAHSENKGKMTNFSVYDTRFSFNVSGVNVRYSVFETMRECLLAAFYCLRYRKEWDGEKWVECRR